VRAVVAYARRVNPTLHIVVRTHSQAEHEFLARYGVTESVVGELELAREMTRYALQHVDGDALEAPEIGGDLRDPRLGRGELRP
jgi:CPA2 family monovalent cation:H+ antiporter-2